MPPEPPTLPYSVNSLLRCDSSQKVQQPTAQLPSQDPLSDLAGRVEPQEPEADRVGAHGKGKMDGRSSAEETFSEKVMSAGAEEGGDKQDSSSDNSESLAVNPSAIKSGGAGSPTANGAGAPLSNKAVSGGNISDVLASADPELNSPDNQDLDDDNTAESTSKDSKTVGDTKMQKSADKEKISEVGT